MKLSNLVIFILINFQLLAQETDLSKEISAVVFLDSFVVSASKKGFDVADFIDIAQKDESFYLAFHNLRFQEHFSNNRINIFNKKRKIKAAYTSRIQQKMDDNCRSMEVLEEEIKGNFYKNKNKKTHQYYTAKMHGQIFLTHGRVCGKPNNPSISQVNLSGIQKHINELKKLIFQPGKEVEVPIIGEKTAIFKKDMLKYYDFSINSKSYMGKWDCYVFKVIAKPKYRNSKTIIKYIETYFDKNNFQVVARNYHLKYNGIFDFDVKMKIELGKMERKYLPTLVEYNGQWKVPFKKREVVKFKVDFEY